jgi:hypothetical protein
MDDFHEAARILGSEKTIDYDKIVTEYPLEEGCDVIRSIVAGKDMGIKVNLVVDRSL